MDENTVIWINIFLILMTLLIWTGDRMQIKFSGVTEKEAVGGAVSQEEVAVQAEKTPEQLF